MTETTDGGVGAAGADGAGAPDPVAELMGTPAAPAAAAEAGAADAGAKWWEGEPFKVSAEKADAKALSDAEWLANKGFKSFEDAVKSHRALEGKNGGAVVLPKDPADKAGYDALYKALGRPDDPKGYEIPVPEGDDGKLAEAFKPVAHDLGLTAAQAKGLAEWLNGTAAEAGEANAAAAREALQGEWGEKMTANLELARRGFTEMGLDNAAVNKIAQGYGLAETMKLFAKLAPALGEAGSLPGGQGGGFGKSAEQIAQRKHEIVNTAELRQKLYDGDPALRAEWDEIAAFEAERAEAALKAA